EITSKQMMEALDEPLQIICETIHGVLERTPPELAADIGNSNIILTGGGALLHGVDKRIAERTGIPVMIAEDPMSCVAIGTGKALNSIDMLENNRLNQKKNFI
ncbi:MAG: rod shape-determining protein, partial [Methanosarcina sp.]|nr:rod shape-determining protein [Methanosarcina sp.]